MRRTFVGGLVIASLFLGLVVGAQEQTPSLCSVRAFFVSPDVDGTIESVLIRFLGGAERSVLISMYSFTDDDLGTAVIRAHQRGVDIRIILEGQNANSTGSEAEKLYRENILIRVDTASGYFHHKFAVIDGETVITGSYNWSNAADDRNFENIVVIQCPEIASVFAREFARLWAFWSRPFEPPSPDGGEWCPGCTCVEKLNRATRAQYEEVHGIGPVLAQRIIEYRDRIGGFTFPYQLKAVPGIGPARMEAILRYFCPELYQ